MLSVAICGCCHDYLDHDGDGANQLPPSNTEDICAWCGDGDYFVVCDGCKRDWCRSCLARHLGGDQYLSEQVDARQRWQCPACEWPDALNILHEKYKQSISQKSILVRASDDTDDEAPQSTALAMAASDALLAFESELAEAQERLEGEMIERLRKEIAAELESAAEVEAELDEVCRLNRRKLYILEREHAVQQEIAEQMGVDLCLLYGSIEMALAEGRIEQASRTWGRMPNVAALRKPSGEDDDVASYTEPDDEHERGLITSATKQLDWERPLKRKRLPNGTTALVGDSLGATGFDERRKRQLGEATYERVYSAMTSPGDVNFGDVSIDSAAAKIDELDEHWAEHIFDPALRDQIERNERRRQAKAKLASYDEAADQHVARRELKRKCRVLRNSKRSSSVSSCSCDAKDVAERWHQPVATLGDRLTVCHSRRSRDNEESIDVSCIVVEQDNLRRNKRNRIPVWEREPQRRVENNCRADAMIWLPANREEKLLFCPTTLGRQSVERPVSDSGHFIAVAEFSNTKISRRLLTVAKAGDGTLEIRRIGKSLVVLDSEELVDARRISRRAATLRLGRSRARPIADKATAAVVEAYLVVPCVEGDASYFDIPPYDPADFEMRRTDAEKCTIRGKSKDDAIEIHDTDEIKKPLLCPARSPAVSGTISVAATVNSLAKLGASMTLKKRKNIEEVIDDHNVSDETRRAKKLEKEKFARLAAKKQRRQSTGSAVYSAESQHDDSPRRLLYGGIQLSANDEYGAREGTALNMSDEPQQQVLLPDYLNGVLKLHQLEGARFIFDQTIESLDQLGKPSETCEDVAAASVPLGCVLAYSMGLGKSLTTIAYIVSLLNHERASKIIRTVLIVAPANVIRNWEAEFKKWCSSDAKLLKRVVVIDAQTGDRRQRVRLLGDWQENGGIAILGYEVYQSLVDQVKVKSPKPAPEQYEAGRKETLGALALRGAVTLGTGAISILGRPDVQADLLAGGIISYQSRTFFDPTRFALYVLSAVGNLDGWSLVTYNGRPLASLRRDVNAMEQHQPTASDIDSVARERVRKELCEQAQKLLQNPGPDVIVLDEAHTIKNPSSKRAIALAGVRTKRRVALTGTPFQNSLMEYHTMITYVRGPVLGTRREFKNRFEDPIKNGMCIDSSPADVKKSRKRSYVLQEEIKGFVLRKDQTLLAKEIKKTEYLIVVKLVDIQQRLYQGFALSDRKINCLKAHQPLLKLGNQPLTHLVDANDDDVISTSAATEPTPQERPLTNATFSVAPKVASKLNALTNSFLSNTNLQFKKRGKRNKHDFEDTIVVDDDEGDRSDEDVYENFHDGDDCDEDQSHASCSGEDDNTMPTRVWVWKKEVLDEVRREFGCDRPPVEDAVHLSSKMIFLFNIIARSLAVHDKVVVFSQSIPSLDYIETLLKTEAWCSRRAKLGGIAAPQGEQRWQCEREIMRIDGGTNSTDRQKKSQSFEASGSEAKVFLISTRAGNMGINLVSANRVILLDSSWNPAVDKQALCRCFRYGQQKHVYIYRLVMQGFEHIVYKRAVQKDLLSLRCVDDLSLERLWKTEELAGLVTDISSEADMCKVCLDDVTDIVLRDTLSAHKNLVLENLVTDTLLRENDAERLDEAEHEDALDE